MSDYISREALIKAVEGNPYVTDSVKSYVRCTARSIPAADVRPVVRGKWGTDRFKMERMICSECGVVLEWSKINNFCPNCGADMREEATP